MPPAHPATDNAPLRPLYDHIGAGYTSRRTPDARIFTRIQTALSGCATVLNVGAGTGSYEPASCILAVEPSRKMIDQRPPRAAPCLQAVAEYLPLKDKSFDGSLASLTLHHWTHLAAGLAGMRRVTRKRIVLFTWAPEFEANFWLMRDYFPSILALDRPRFPTMRQLEEVLGPIEVHPVPIPEDCTDGFIGAFWKRPHAFLDPAVQRANSAMSQITSQELQDGLDRLDHDLKTSAWSQKNASLESQTELDLGYRLVISSPA